MMPISSITIPTQVKFGFGARDSIRDAFANTPAQRILVIATSSSLKRPMVAKILDDLRTIGDVRIWDDVMPNPRVSHIDACCAAHKDWNVTHIVGIGGGSALDQAKATAVALDMGETVKTLLARKTALPKRKNILVLLPTTAGTGAELSFGAILTDEETQAKTGLRGVNVAADYAFVDPDLTMSVPHVPTMVTGFDVLTHAIETYFSTAASAFTQDLSRGAIERVFEFLPMLKTSPDNKEARAEMAYASMAMGINLALSTTCLPHRLQYPLGAATDTAHAEGLAALYPAWIAYIEPFVQVKMARAAEWIGAADPAASDAENATKFRTSVVDLLAQIDLDITLDDLGIDQNMSKAFTAQVSGLLTTDPGYSDLSDIAKIYANSHR